MGSSRVFEVQGRASVAGGRKPEATEVQGRASVAGGRKPEATEVQGRASVAGGRNPKRPVPQMTFPHHGPARAMSQPIFNCETL
jgi:hypothetical protein